MGGIKVQPSARKKNLAVAKKRVNEVFQQKVWTITNRRHL